MRRWSWSSSLGLRPLSRVLSWCRLDDVEPFEVSRGVQARKLWSDEDGRSAWFLDFSANSTWGSQTLGAGHEELYVVSGVLNDGTRDYPAGTFVHRPADATQVKRSDGGCRLFAFYAGGQRGHDERGNR